MIKIQDDRPGPNELKKKKNVQRPFSLRKKSTLFKASQSVLTSRPLPVAGTKETAFIYAILSAGVVHSVTQACSAGNLTDCSCDMSRYGEADVEGWKWGGCSDNVNYGLWFAKNFVDAPETMRHEDSRNIRNLMNLHNNEVGRRVSRVQS